MANLTERSTINISLTKLIAICIAIFSLAIGGGTILEDLNRTASATEQNTRDIVDLKVLNARMAQLLEYQQKQLDHLEHDN